MTLAMPNVRAGGHSVILGTLLLLVLLMLMLAPPSSHRRIVTPVCAALSRRARRFHSRLSGRNEMMLRTDESY